MKILHYQDMEASPVEMEGVKGVTIRWLIAKEDGAQRFAMRLFEVEPGGHTPLHTHGIEHEVFFLEGEGAVWCEGKDIPVKAGTAIFVPPDEKHRFRNTGNNLMRFICVVPI